MTENVNYYFLNKSRIQDRINQVIDCPVCGEKVRHGYLKRHRNTKKCRLIDVNKVNDDVNNHVDQLNKKVEILLQKLDHVEQLMAKA